MMETLLLRRVKRICCVSEGLRKETVSRIGFAKSSCVQVIPNWIEPYWYQKNSNNVEYRCVVDGKQIRICGVGRLVREKGFDILVESISILRSKGYDVTCDIYGDGPEAEVLNKQIIDIGVSRSVILKGIKEAVRMSLPSYDVLVIPSRSESFGITALEAFDASVPVVASDIEGLRELVVDRYSGLSFMPDDPRSLANALRELLLSENLRQSLISNGHQVLNKYLPCKAFLDSYREFYAQALKT
jgi:glycosyltransferase involved in cell wall biosynthesis